MKTKLAGFQITEDQHRALSQIALDAGVPKQYVVQALGVFAIKFLDKTLTSRDRDSFRLRIIKECQLLHDQRTNGEPVETA